ncbi:hypothetical protein Aperf_G00000104609 [Anoplocephala perfoliata]
MSGGTPNSSIGSVCLPFFDKMPWTVDEEIQLFLGLMVFKPVGRDRNFQMICLAYKLQNEAKLTYSISEIWQRLRELYDIDLLSEVECLPYSEKQCEFSLPGYFNYLKAQDFPRCESNPSTQLISSALPLEKTKVKSEYIAKPVLPPDENPQTSATNSSSTSPSSVSNNVPSLTTKRTRKSMRSTSSEKDKSMPPPSSSVSPGKANPTSTSRKSTRQKH